MLDIPNIRMQHHRRHWVCPPGHIRPVASPHQQVGLGAHAQHADVRPPQRQPAMLRRHQERLLDAHRALVRHLPAIQHAAVPRLADLLQPQPALGQDVGRERKGRVDAERGVVLDLVAAGVIVAVVRFRFGRDGDVVVLGAEESRACGRKEAGVRKDDGDGGVEEAVAVEGFGVIGYCV